jgi:hypothetical protein
MQTPSDSPFSEIIFAYTRQQAITDGYQVDVSSYANEAGIAFPVFLTRAVFDAYVAGNVRAAETVALSVADNWKAMLA